MNTCSYLDQMKTHFNIESDYALAKELGIATAVISRYRSGKSGFDDYMCFVVAEILSVNPLEVLANINAEREKKRPHVKEYFINMAKNLAENAKGATLTLAAAALPLLHGVHGFDGCILCKKRKGCE